MSSTSVHDEWLSLIEISGPFLAIPVLKEVFPQGPEELDGSKRKRLRQAYEEWREALETDDPQFLELHAAWIDEVLSRGLELDEDRTGDVLKRGDRVPASLRVTSPEHGVTLAPDFAIVDSSQGDKPLMLIQTYEADVDLEATMKHDGWAANPAERMVQLCRLTGCRIGLVTNGERWMLVDAPVGAVTTFASWYARIWSQEPITLQAFVDLLGIRRFFFDQSEQLPALFDRSLKHQDEVTEALGEQVRRAVEVLIQSLDKADLDRNRELLRDVAPAELYETGLTVMMRLVFLLSAEERGLLLLGDERYEANYALSTLRMKLRTESEEILERRWDAWSRLLAIFRAVFGGIEHENLRLPALGGSLFDPDRFPFLEGRVKGSDWRSDTAKPLPIDNRTVLLLLEAIQQFHGRTLSYRALDVEQIGYVYEGLLERTVKRTEEVTLELDATKSAKTPWVKLAELESAKLDGDNRLIELLLERSGSSTSRVRNDLAKPVEDALADRLLTACQGDSALRGRIKPYAHLLRTDPWGYPLIYPKGAFIVTTGSDRRETGTHYTPKSLTETIVTETLTPVAYVGPAEGKPRDKWVLKSPAELLDLKICDPAMGSGAFLVQACRWLAERLVEAWSQAEVAGKAVSVDGEVLDASNTKEPLPRDTEARILIAHRLVAERCLYGVDLNPLAVELAKLSLWLVTLAKGYPFGFLDHNLRCGNSLLGIDHLEQLIELAMAPTIQTQGRLFGKSVRQAVDEAMVIRLQLREIPIRDIGDVGEMASLDAAARAKVAIPARVADAFIGLVFATDGAQDLEKSIAALGIEADIAAQGNTDALTRLERQSLDDLGKGTLNGRRGQPFHWPLEFPEVFLRPNGGFDAFVGNPPFLGNRLWKGTNGASLQRIVQIVLESAVGKIDLCVAFHRRATALLRRNGTYGLLATSNIAEGSALSVGLERIAAIGDFYFTRKSMPWPGAASTVIAIVCFWKGSWNGLRTCNGALCPKISPRLQPETVEGWEPKTLEPPLFAFPGVDNSKGLAFLVTSADKWFDRLRSERDSLLRPYVTGDDITSSSLTRLERWALDIGDIELATINSRWPVAARFLSEVVQPTRTPQELESYPGLAERWWKFSRNRTDQLGQLRSKPDCIVFAKAAKYQISLVAPSSCIYTNKVILVRADREDLHAIFLSSLCQAWLHNFSVRSLGADNKTTSLSISKAFWTYPLPHVTVSQYGVAAAKKFQEVLESWSKMNYAGMTDAMNAVHYPGDSDPEIVKMRGLLARLDMEVASAYGWTDVDLAHDFRHDIDAEGMSVVRHGLDVASRGRLLDMLIGLNRTQHEATGAPNPISAGGRPRGRQAGGRSSAQASLLPEERTGYEGSKV
ncbi:MAG: hypothetical protein AAB433_01435 [Nitrospirota bacterium]